MKHRPIRRWDLGIIVIFILFLGASQPVWGMNEIGPEELVLPISYSEIILHPEEMSEDLDYIIQMVGEVHPFLEHKENQQFFRELSSLAKAKVKEPMSRQEFYLIANQLVNFLDSQTHLWYLQEDRYLPVRLRWLEDGIVVTDVLDPHLPVSVGDELLTLGGYRPNDLLAELRNLLPNENDYHILALGGRHLTAGYILEVLGVISKSGKVEMTYQKPSGEIYTFPVPWRMVASEESSPLLPVEPDPWYGWQIKEEENYAFFWLDYCKNTTELQAAVQSFFVKVHTTGVDHVVLDLRRNTGGEIEVLDSILAYLPSQIVQFPTTTVRYSKQAQETDGYSWFGHLLTSIFQRVWNGDKAVLRPKDRSSIFEGELIVLTSHQTFGTGTMIATILRDNDLATVVGEPTGNPPSSYGDALSFYTPNLKFYLTVSYKKFARPDANQDPMNTLMPDHLVPTTIQDLRLGKDPQLEWVENHCKKPDS